MTLLTCIALPVAAAFLAAAMPGETQSAGPESQTRLSRLVVAGTGTAKASPDVAYVSLGVVTSGKRAQEASQANAATADKVMAAIRKLGIAEKDIQTTGYSVQPVYRNGDYSRGIEGYQVSNVVRATVRKLGSLGAIIDSGLDAGANNVQSVSFGLENHGPADDRALTEAVQAARRKAEVLARAAGVRITRVLEISTAYDERPVPMMAGGFGTERSMARVATPVSPGELDVTANVTMVFAISE